MSQINSSSYADLNAAHAAIMAAGGGTIFIDANTALSANLTTDRSVKLKVYMGNLIDQGAYSLNCLGPFSADSTKVFPGTGAVALGKRTHRCNPRWFGLDEFASASTNGTALNASVDALTPIVEIPAGTFNYSSDIVIDRCIRFDGAGSGNGSGIPGDSSTVLDYTGTGIGLNVLGTGGEGKENIHLSNFILKGTAYADDGLVIGSSGFVTKSTFKNIEVQWFRKVGARGWAVLHCLESKFENAYGHINYKGIECVGANTTLNFDTCHMRSNDNKGWHFKNLNCATLINCVSESNFDEAFCFDGASIQDVTSITLFNCDSENNQRSTGAASIAIYGGSRIDVIGGSWTDPVLDANSPNGRLLYFDRAENCIIDQPGFATFSYGFALCTSNTYFCVVKAPPTYCTVADIVNNSVYGGAYRVTVTI